MTIFLIFSNFSCIVFFMAFFLPLITRIVFSLGINRATNTDFLHNLYYVNLLQQFKKVCKKVNLALVFYAKTCEYCREYFFGVHTVVKFLGWQPILRVFLIFSKRFE